jgi:hypothetical protein
VESYTKEKQVKLCSDAFSHFIKSDPNKEIHNQEVAAASEYLRTKVVPDFVTFLEEKFPDGKAPSAAIQDQTFLMRMAMKGEKQDLPEIDFISLMHDKGINCRLLVCLFHLSIKRNSRDYSMKT